MRATCKTIMPARRVVAWVFRLRLTSARCRCGPKVECGKVQYTRQKQGDDCQTRKCASPSHYRLFYHTRRQFRGVRLPESSRTAATRKSRRVGPTERFVSRRQASERCRGRPKRSDKPKRRSTRVDRSIYGDPAQGRGRANETGIVASVVVDVDGGCWSDGKESALSTRSVPREDGGWAFAGAVITPEV